MSYQTPIRTLLFSTIHPGRVRPVPGTFVEMRPRELLSVSGQVEVTVVEPEPRFFDRSVLFPGESE